MVASQISDVVGAPSRLDYTPEVARATASIFERVRRVIPEIEWPVHAPYIAAINELKRERNAIILAHNYQTPEIFHGVADLAGDSLALARQAARTDAEVIVLCVLVECDIHGNSLFERNNAEINERVESLYEGLRPPALRRFGETRDKTEELI